LDGFDIAGSLLLISREAPAAETRLGRFEIARSITSGPALAGQGRRFAS
jgi:hypothetical protein